MKAWFGKYLSLIVAFYFLVCAGLFASALNWDAAAAWWFSVEVLNKYEPDSDCAPINKIERRVHHAI